MQIANGLTHGMAMLALCLVATVPAACAAPSSGGADAQGFTLTSDFLARYQAAELDIAKDPCRLGFVKLMGLGGEDASQLSLDQAAARYDAQPGVRAMLARHGLTAKTMLLGTRTLLMAGVQDMRQAHPGVVEGGNGAQVSAANLAFYRAHKQAIRQFGMQLGQQQLRANGGKLPDCMRES